MSILKIILVPLSLILSLFVWLCAGLLSCSGFVFKLASGLGQALFSRQQGLGQRHVHPRQS